MDRLRCRSASEALRPCISRSSEAASKRSCKLPWRRAPARSPPLNRKSFSGARRAVAAPFSLRKRKVGRKTGRASAGSVRSFSSQRVPGGLAGNVDLLDSDVPDARSKDREDPGVVRAGVERGVHKPDRNEDAIARAENALLVLVPMLEAAGEHIDHLFLSRVVMEGVSVA